METSYRQQLAIPALCNYGIWSQIFIRVDIHLKIECLWRNVNSTWCSKLKLKIDLQQKYETFAIGPAELKSFKDKTFAYLLLEADLPCIRDRTPVCGVCILAPRGCLMGPLKLRW
jgi:hypothetical protein